VLGVALDLALPRLCAACREPVEAQGLCRAAVRFDDISRALVHALKYGGRLDLAPMMGRWLSHAGRDALAEADALVPVPLHWRRRWARRFNQSAMLAAAISAASSVPIAAGALKRVKATVQQVGLSRSERATNVQGAFRVPPEGRGAVAGRRLVLVDDVLTSGATVEGCAGRCFAPGPLTSTFWSSPGLPMRPGHPYKGLI
jgi:ComF family protein